GHRGPRRDGPSRAHAPRAGDELLEPVLPPALLHAAEAREPGLLGEQLRAGRPAGGRPDHHGPRCGLQRARARLPAPGPGVVTSPVLADPSGRTPAPAAGERPPSFVARLIAWAADQGFDTPVLCLAPGLLRSGVERLRER